MEHLQHFGLSQDPFQNNPDLRYYFESAAHRDGQRRVERGLRQAKGLCVLSGEPGTGKSLLARRILEGLEEELFEACMMVAVKSTAGSGSFLRRFAGQLEIESPAADPAALMGQIFEQLAVVREDGRHTVLIIDEASGLSSEAFGEVSSLINLEYEERRLLSILLVGPPELDDALAEESALLQRVDVRVRLQALSLEDAAKYLTHRITTSGGGTAILPPEAVNALFKYGRGRPRLMNTLADNALFEAFLGGRPAIAPLDVERAAADLGIGEDPGSTYSALPPHDDDAFSVPGGDAAAGAALDPGASLSDVSFSGAESALDLEPAPAVLGELADPDAGPGTDPSASDSAIELESLLGDDISPSDVATRVHLEPEAEASHGTLDLDAALEADGDSGAALPSFQAANTESPVEAEATRLALPEEQEQLDDPPDASDGEIDDLFVELLDN